MCLDPFSCSRTCTLCVLTNIHCYACEVPKGSDIILAQLSLPPLSHVCPMDMTSSFHTCLSEGHDALKSRSTIPRFCIPVFTHSRNSPLCLCTEIQGRLRIVNSKLKELVRICITMTLVEPSSFAFLPTAKCSSLQMLQPYAAGASSTE